MKGTDETSARLNGAELGRVLACIHRPEDSLVQIVVDNFGGFVPHVALQPQQELKLEMNLRRLNGAAFC